MTNTFIPATVTTKEKVFVFTSDCIEIRTVRGQTFPAIVKEVMDSFAEVRFFPTLVVHQPKIVNGVEKMEYMIQLDSMDKYTRNPKVMYLSEGQAVAIDTMNPTETIRRLPPEAIIKTA